ncbi:MAG: ABC transporter permease [Candidatus Hydrothermarchaeaceae archaeon]
MGAIHTIWLREMKLFLRARSRIAGSIATPFFWLAFVGMGFRSAFTINLPTDYLTFMAPGIIGMSLLFSSMFSGLSVLWDRQFGFLKEILVAPVSRVSVIVGKTLGGATISTIQGIAILFISLLMGVQLKGTAGIPIAILFMVLISASFISLGLAFASRMEDPHGFQLIMGFIIIPIFFLSGALFPIDRLPAWLRILSYIDPLTYGVDGLRGALIGISQFPIWLDFLAVGGFLALATIIGSYLFSTAT